MATKILNKIAAAAVMATLAGSLVPAYCQTAAGDAPAVKAEMQRTLTAYLSGEGFQPTVDGDGDVVFKREGRTYFIHVYPSDPTYLRVVLPNILKIENDDQRRRAMVAANYSTMTSKATKTIVTPKDYVWVTWEAVLKGPDDYKAVLLRSLSGLENGASNFASKYRESDAQASLDGATTRVARP